MRGTQKQIEIMTLVVEAAARGQVITVDDLTDRLSYKPSRSAAHCSVKFLRNHGLLEKISRGCRGTELVPTAMAMSTFKSTPGFP